MKATAILYADNSETSYGILTFKQENATTSVRITGELSGLNASSAHGFHVHVYPVSKSMPNCTAAGGHFNPYNTTHGPRTADIRNRHVGDLGNLTTNENGTVDIDMEDWIIQLYNETQSIVNRTIIVHRLRDDGGQGGFSDSNTTGNAGARVLCGLIQSSNGLIIKPILFGFHVHVYPVSKSMLNCTAAGGHFNPYIGNLGNLTTNENGTVNIDMKDCIIQLNNATPSTANRTIIIHLLRDNSGKVGFPDSTATSKTARVRIYFGLIKVLPHDVQATLKLTEVT
ncbi:unnamed protein product [Rotaria sp. Silwood2]|nr:unnamed protein product [Rotaria sp. Silwood2]CAF4187191.1 unnamed protein product [Rotaria sp. Silwood2]CAF4269444.1 unnamed protein product [Rotaria sp. Silwood2]